MILDENLKNHKNSEMIWIEIFPRTKKISTPIIIHQIIPRIITERRRKQAKHFMWITMWINSKHKTNKDQKSPSCPNSPSKTRTGINDPKQQNVRHLTHQFFKFNIFQVSQLFEISLIRPLRQISPIVISSSYQKLFFSGNLL
jgi:hypothetical protein